MLSGGEGWTESAGLGIIAARMAEPVLHYYNVVLGKCLCGVLPKPGEKTFSVFPQRVTCSSCLALLKGSSGKPGGS